MALAIGQKFVLVLLVLGNFVTISLQASTKKSDSYVAAVVEYAPVSGVTLENKDEVFMQNVAVYGCLMEQAAKQGVDIIVFPEIGLASFGVPLNEDDTPSLAFYVPEPGENPCNDNSSEIAQGLRELSCAAGKHQLYAVVNLPERVNCSGCPCPGFPVTVDGPECPPAGAYFHNTNVVFDRNGTIVARYRKFNLFGEPGFVPTQQPEFATFETDFGVTFGTFICFDIMFEKPAVELMKEHFVCDFAFPTAWFSEVPFLTAVQTQAAWAYAMDVNLLAAGYDMPEVGSAGSGIFVGRGGALQTSMPNATTSQLLVATVPKIRRCKEAAKARRRRAPPPEDIMPPEADDDESAVERTPLSAFHHIVRMRKLGHIGPDDDSEPSWEYETKVPPHFMGLHQAEQEEDDEQSEQALQGCIEYEEETPEDSLHSRPQEGIPVKKIPASTDTEHHVIGLPSQNPDLLKLYQIEEVEKLPEDFLEIEVPEEQPFEPEQEQEYFEHPPVEERQGGSDETGGQQSLPAGDGAAAAGDSDDLGAPPLQEEKESEQTSIGTELWEESDDISTRMYEGQRNVTEQEIEDTRKQFEWLTDDRDTPEKEWDVSSAPSTGNEEPARDPVDDTDDILPENEPDAAAATDASPKPETESSGELTGGSKSDTLADNKQPSKLLGKLKKSSSHREHWRSRMDRLKRKSEECKCRRRHKQQKSSPDVHGTITEEKLATESPSENKKPEEQQVPFNDLDREGAGEDTQNDKQPRNGDDFNLEADTGDTQPEEKQAPSVELGLEAVAEDIKPEEQPPRADDQDLEASTEDTQPEKEPTTADESEFQPIAEETQSDAKHQTKCDLEDARCKPTRPCRIERPESACPPISNGVLDDERVNKSTVGLFLKRDHLEVYKTFTLNTESLIENSTLILCHGTFCCNFHVVLEVNAELDQPRYAYRLAVFDGVRTFDGVTTGGVQVCAVIPCSHEDMDSCGMLTLPDDAAYATVFRTISISGVFSTNHTLVTANTVGPGLQALPVDKFNLTSAPLSEGEARVSLQTTAAVQQEGLSLFTFGIYSRVFNRDGQPVTAPP